MTPLAQEAPPKPEAPYRGIESFRYIDQRIFSARDEETWDLLSNILIYRGVLFYRRFRLWEVVSSERRASSGCGE